jgi:hypothetical protein
VLDLDVMTQASNAEIGQRLFSSGHLDQFAQAVAADDPMQVVAILLEVGVDKETISRMLLQLDKEYLLSLVDAGRAAAG